MTEPITRQICWNNDGGMRKFRCFNINHHVNNEDVDDIIREKLGYNDDDYGCGLLDALLQTHSQHLARTIPEVFFEVLGTINDEDIEELLCEEISEATGWLHAGFEFEEIKEAI